MMQRWVILLLQSDISDTFSKVQILAKIFFNPVIVS